MKKEKKTAIVLILFAISILFIIVVSLIVIYVTDFPKFKTSISTVYENLGMAVRLSSKIAIIN